METPQLYTTAGITTLISGVLNIVTGMMLLFSFIWVCVGIVWLIPIAVGVIEVVTGVKMLQGTPQPAAKTVSVAGLASGILNCNPIPIGCEIASLLMLSQPDVAGYLEVGSGRELY